MKLFKGKFNHQGQIHELYTHARDEMEAFGNFINQMSRILKTGFWSLYAYFKMDKRKKYEIEEVRE